jgi:hypothetical protein
MAGTVKAVSLVDSLRWNEGEGDERHVVTFDGDDGSGAKGQTVEIPSSEFDRLEAAGVVAKPRSDAAKAAIDEADDTPPVLPPIEKPGPEETNP